MHVSRIHYIPVSPGVNVSRLCFSVPRGLNHPNTIVFQYPRKFDSFRLHCIEYPVILVGNHCFEGFVYANVQA